MDSYRRVNAVSVRNVGLLTVFAARHMQEKCQKQNADLCSTYVDLAKAFDMVNKDDPERIMAKYSCFDKFITIVRQFHDGMHVIMQDNGESSVAFPVTNGVKRGCVLASTLFSIMFSTMLLDAFSGSDNGIDIRYHTDGSVFKVRKLQAKTKVKTDIVNEFLFADDCTLQNSVDKFWMACENFGLTNSTKKKKQKWCTS